MEPASREQTTLYKARRTLAKSVTVGLVIGATLGGGFSVYHTSRDPIFNEAVEHYQKKTQEHESMITKLRNEHRQLAAERTNLESTLRKEAENKLREATSAILKEIAVQGAAYTNRLQELEQERARLAVDITNTIKRLENEYGSKIQQAKEKFEAQVNEERKSMQKVRDDYANLMSEAQIRYFGTLESLIGIKDVSVLTPLEREMLFIELMGAQFVEAAQKREYVFYDGVLEGTQTRVVGARFEQPATVTYLALTLLNATNNAPLLMECYLDPEVITEVKGQKLKEKNLSYMLTNAIPRKSIRFEEGKKIITLDYIDKKGIIQEGKKFVSQTDDEVLIQGRRVHDLDILTDVRKAYMRGISILAREREGDVTTKKVLK